MGRQSAHAVGSLARGRRGTSPIQRGLTLVEVVASLAILSGALAGLSMIGDVYSQDTKATIAANQVRTFGEASRAYLKDNYSAVQLVAGPTSPAMIDASTLIASGHLAAGFSSVNAYGQVMCALVLEPTANKLQALVISEGGTPIDDITLGVISAIVGGSGGAVYSTAPAAVRGAMGGWELSASSFDDLTNNVTRRCDGTAGNVRIVPGTPAMALWFENGDTSSAFLAREAVPGRPELNELNTPLVLNSVVVPDDACTRLGSIARDATGAVMNCRLGQWKAAGGGSEFWKDPVSTFATLPPCDAGSVGHTRVVEVPSVGSGPRAYSCIGGSWAALSLNDSGNLLVPSKIIGSGGQGTYGSITVQGDKNSYAGVNFRNSGGDSAGTLMMHSSYGGFFRADDTNWRWYVDDAGNSWQPGTANVADAYVRSIGRHVSQIFGGAFSTNIYVGCYIGNPRAGGACGCPGGFGAHPTGQFSVYAGSDSNAYVCQQ
ncbi:MAG: hypothetical protein B7X65_17810 [Polaromonas sp. 39-63-25]|nr:MULTISPECIES: shufflon system plasmid conjugative transfer pilus tip adhesin PilV [unclassified Polaromonas]OYY33349.1 MAG: hypothetical protein B7Y60_19155 [Polaromonas sp. 35-63-35]OYZ18283.1 MAG: hypothetical protein B7Y28_16390 [Polaromonas sp. 16-63-31]OZA86364.1 MAG: hypothetical protein B7X65_17810 [Polaromonas sp. 39-63-25]OYZ77072.1 MAG: hypothetical protein B7Y09_18270 [Polaromonas sp. 24-63-21]OZA48086.1 MAG: hypothetical protein B7X88_19885 [Polaromonas sp. 17-63-33]